MSLAGFRFLAVLTFLSLGGCSYTYGLQAVMIDGRVAFIVAPSSNRQPDCVGNIDVVAESPEAQAEPAVSDDDKFAVEGGVYWRVATNGASCEGRFPVFYGTNIEGLSDENSRAVAAKPLKTGVIYQVNATSRGSGYGAGWFKILPDGQIENYASAPSSPRLLPAEER